MPIVRCQAINGSSNQNQDKYPPVLGVPVYLGRSIRVLLIKALTSFKDILFNPSLRAWLRIDDTAFCTCKREINSIISCVFSSSRLIINAMGLLFTVSNNSLACVGFLCSAEGAIFRRLRNGIYCMFFV